MRLLVTLLFGVNVKYYVHIHTRRKIEEMLHFVELHLIT